MRSRNRWTGMVMGVFIGVLFSAVVVLAGDLAPIAGPTEADSQMYTLEQIYDRLNAGTAGTKVSTFTGPSSGPTTGTMHTLDEIYNLVGLRAPVAKTGQILCYDVSGYRRSCASEAGTGQDGDLKKGVAWPNPRFTDNSNGTVTDNLTGLIWLKNANCTDMVGTINKSLGYLNWADALTWSNNLAAGHCGLIDGSTVGQWRLPNRRELFSLIDDSNFNPALPTGYPFTGVQSNNYWSSTTFAANTVFLWIVSLYDGTVRYDFKTNTYYVWPVRGGQ